MTGHMLVETTWPQHVIDQDARPRIDAINTPRESRDDMALITGEAHQVFSDATGCARHYNFHTLCSSVMPGFASAIVSWLGAEGCDDKSVIGVLLRRWPAVGHNQGVNRIYEDEKIGIRQFGPEDAEPLLLAVRETADDLCRWMVWGRADYSLEDSRGFIARSATEWDKGTWYTFVVYGKKEGEFLGSIGLSAVDRVHGYAQVGYWVRRARRGEGSGRQRFGWRLAMPLESWGCIGWN